MTKLGFQLDPENRSPLYAQIQRAIADRIDSGAFPAGFRLPATRALAEELGTHRTTVVRAYEELGLSGYVHSSVGRGTFVADRAVVESSPAPRSAQIPWASLVSEVADAEPMRRLERLRRAHTGPGVINLTRSQPSEDLMPDQLFRRCVDHVLRTRGCRALEYAPRDGVPRLRELIGEELSRRGVPVTADDVIVTSGSQQALDVVVRALVDPGDTFLVEDATYSGALNVLAASRARVLPVPCDEFGPQVGAIRRLARGRIKGLYVIPNAQNPTGHTMTLGRRRELVQWSREAGVPIVEDDYVAGIDLVDEQPPPALRTLDRDVLHIGTFSKNVMPALRIGYLVAPPAMRETLVSLKAAMDLGTSAFLQECVAEFLERGYMRTHLNRTRPVYRARRDALRDALRDLLPDEVTVYTPNRGIAIWLELPATLDAERVYELARREGVLVAPGVLNGVDRRHGIRVNFCSEDEHQLVEGAKRLGRAVDRALANQLEPSGAALDVV